MKQYSFLLESSNIVTTIDHNTGKEIKLAEDQYDELARKYPDKYWSRKSQDDTMNMLRKWKVSGDPRYQKYLEYCKLKGIQPII